MVDIITTWWCDTVFTQQSIAIFLSTELLTQDWNPPSVFYVRIYPVIVAVNLFVHCICIQLRLLSIYLWKDILKKKFAYCISKYHVVKINNSSIKPVDAPVLEWHNAAAQATLSSSRSLDPLDYHTCLNSLSTYKRTQKRAVT